MPKAPTEIRSLARSHTEMALNVLVGIASASSAPESARVAAACHLLDRGRGKPTQLIGGDPENGPVQIQRIEHVIVPLLEHKQDE